ncbi:MAG: hypothetical protein AVDCRST_MAG21-577, partial [uncultured Nocardioidaceae bacterium]
WTSSATDPSGAAGCRHAPFSSSCADGPSARAPDTGPPL